VQGADSSSEEMPRQQSERHADQVDGAENAEILLQVAVCPEKDEQSESGAREWARHQCARAHRAGKIELGAGDGDRAIGDETEESCGNLAEQRLSHAQVLEAMFAEVVHAKLNGARHDDDEEEDFGRVDQRGHEDALVLAAAAAAVFAKFADGHFAAEMAKNTESVDFDFSSIDY